MEGTTTERPLKDNWTAGEYCRRKGGSMITYYVAETNDAGAKLQLYRSGKLIGQGKWHNWKIMGYEFTPSCPRKELKLTKLF